MTSNVHPPNQNYNLTYAGTNFSTHELPNSRSLTLMHQDQQQGQPSNGRLHNGSTPSQGTSFSMQEHDQLRQIQQGPSTYRVNFPALLPGPIYFTDASIAPNQGTSQ
jgi:hypothetical protein